MKRSLYGVLAEVAAVVLLLGVIALACFLSAAPARGAWGGASCGPVGPPAFLFPPAAAPARACPCSECGPACPCGSPYACRKSAAPAYEWREYADHDPACVYLWDAANRRQVGAFKFSDRTYHELLSDDAADPFGPPVAPPIPPPDPGPRAGACPNYGLTLDRIRSGQTTINGQAVSKGEAFAAIAAVPDDADAMRITAIGTEAECSPVGKDLEASPALSPWKGGVLYQDYRPADWPVAGAGFKTDGHPTVYVQSPDGTVLHRQDSYDGPEALAAALGKIRKPDPLYTPASDPNLSKDWWASLQAFAAKNPVLVYGGAGVVVLLLWLRRRA